MLGVDSMAHQFLPAFAHPHDPAAGGPGFWATDYGDRTGMGGGGGHRRLESGGAMPPDSTGGPQPQQQAPLPPPTYSYALPPHYMYGHPPKPTLPPPPAPVPTSALLGLPPSVARPGGMPLPPHPMLGGQASAPSGPLPAPVQQHHHGAHPGGRQRSMACMACRHSKLRCTKERPACKRCARLKIECIPQTRGSYTAAAADAARLAMIHRPKKEHSSCSGSRGSNDSASSSPRGHYAPAHSAAHAAAASAGAAPSPAPSSSSLSSWDGGAPPPNTHAGEMPLHQQPPTLYHPHPGASSSSSMPGGGGLGALSHYSAAAFPAAAGPPPGPTPFAVGQSAGRPEQQQHAGSSGDKAGVFLLSSLAAAALEEERRRAAAAPAPAAAAIGPYVSTYQPSPQQPTQPPPRSRSPSPSHRPQEAEWAGTGVGTGERLSDLTAGADPLSGNASPAKRPRTYGEPPAPAVAAPVAAPVAPAAADEEEERFEAALQTLLVDCYAAGEHAAASALAAGAPGGGSSEGLLTAACAATWVDGRLELSCNDAFAARCLARADFQRALDASGWRPDALWGRCLAPEWREGLSGMYRDVVAAAAAARGLGGRAAMEMGAIDRATGVPAPALLALHALVSPCRRFLAIVCMLLPLGASGAWHHGGPGGGGRGNGGGSLGLR